MIRLIRTLLLVSVFFAGALASANSLGLITGLEANITRKVKGILDPVDPNAIINVNVVPKRLTTPLPVTGMEAMGFFATESVAQIETEDVEKIQVSVFTSVQDFPKEVSKLIEEAVKPYTKKGSVQISKMDPRTTTLLAEREARANQTNETVKAIAAEYVGHLNRLTYILAGGIGGLSILAALVLGLFLSRSLAQISERVANIKIEGGASAPMPMMRPEDFAPRAERNVNPVLPSPKGSQFDEMPTTSVRALICDCYWCEKDSYANWIWSQLSPGRKSELLSQWDYLPNYVEYISRLDVREERYHNDPYYLNPAPIDFISNAELMNLLKQEKALWSIISSMRKEAAQVSLRERLEMSKSLPPAGRALAIPQIRSNKRNLPLQLEIESLTEDDELLLFHEPHLITPEVAKKLPSLVWVALLPSEERSKIVNAVSAQALAETWIGPAEVLAKIEEVIPEKKKPLFDEYRSKVQPRRSSPWMKVMTDAAIPVLEMNPPAEVIQPIRAA